MAFGFSGTGGDFTFSPFEDTESQQRYGQMLAIDPAAAAYGLMGRSGYKPEASFGSFIAGLAPLLEVLRTTVEAKRGLAGAQPSANTFGGLLSALLNPRQAGVSAENVGMTPADWTNPQRMPRPGQRPEVTGGAFGPWDLVGQGLQNIRDVGAGNAGASSYLDDPSVVGNDVRALISTQLGGRSANRLFSNDFLSRLIAQFTNQQQESGGTGQNIVQHLQGEGVF